MRSDGVRLRDGIQRGVAADGSREAIPLAWQLTAGVMHDTLYFFEVNHGVCAQRLSAVIVPGLPLERVVVEVGGACCAAWRSWSQRD